MIEHGIEPISVTLVARLGLFVFGDVRDSHGRPTLHLNRPPLAGQVAGASLTARTHEELIHAVQFVDGLRKDPA